MKFLRVDKKDDETIELVLAFFKNRTEFEISQQQLESFLSDDRTYFFIAGDEEIIVGYAIVFRFPAFAETGFLAYLYDIEVVENYRKTGIGKRLIKEILPVLRIDGVTELWLGTATDNAAGQALFTSTGGIKSGETFNDFTYDLS